MNASTQAIDSHAHTLRGAHTHAALVPCSEPGSLPPIWASSDTFDCTLPFRVDPSPRPRQVSQGAPARSTHPTGLFDWLGPSTSSSSPHPTASQGDLHTSSPSAAPLGPRLVPHPHPAPALRYCTVQHPIRPPSADAPSSPRLPLYASVEFINKASMCV